MATKARKAAAAPADARTPEQIAEQNRQSAIRDILGVRLLDRLTHSAYHRVRVALDECDSSASHAAEALANVSRGRIALGSWRMDRANESRAQAEEALRALALAARANVNAYKAALVLGVDVGPVVTLCDGFGVVVAVLPADEVTADNEWPLEFACALAVALEGPVTA